MKCRACNYEHENIHSNIPFKRLRMFGKDSEIEFYTDGYKNGIYKQRILTYLHVCPMCATVRIEEMA